MMRSNCESAASLLSSSASVRFGWMTSWPTSCVYYRASLTASEVPVWLRISVRMVPRTSRATTPASANWIRGLATVVETMPHPRRCRSSSHIAGAFCHVPVVRPTREVASPANGRKPSRTPSPEWPRPGPDWQGQEAHEPMQEQTSLQVADLAAAVGLDDRPLHLTRPVDEEDHRLGPLDASAQLVEYGDYQCPFCAEALPGVKRILSRYGDRILFVFRHFPLVSQHPRAWRAALTAEAAGAQGRFWPMHDHLLGHQHELSEDELRTHARALGLDLAAYDRDLHDPALAQRVREDALSGIHSGVLGTPTFFVNGRRLEGGFKQDELESAMELAVRVPD